MDAASGQKAGVRRELLLMRHAKSSGGAEGLPDFDRELSSRGRRDAGRVGHWLAETDRLPDHVICSPARRAHQTAEAVLESLGLGLDDVRWAERIYEAAPADLLGVLGQTPGEVRRVLMIGHNPGFEILVERLASASVPIPRDGKFFPTASVAHLLFEGDWNTLLPGRCELTALVRPRELAPES
jgi:phosphohistidine phosphatase